MSRSVAQWWTTVEVSLTPQVSAFLDALAAMDAVTSAAVGAAGTKSASYAAFEQLRDATDRVFHRRLSSHASPVVRGYFARLLVPDASSDELDALYGLLADDAPVSEMAGCIGSETTVSQIVCEALCGASDRVPVQELLLRASRDGGLGPIRGNALTCLAKVRPDDARAVAMALLESESIALVRAAVMTVGMTDPRSAETELCALAEHEDHQVRAFTATALGKVRTPAAQRALVGLTRDDDDYVRMLAAGAYAASPAMQPSVVERLLSDPKTRVQDLAAEGLARAATPQAMTLLVPLLMQDRSPGRAVAILAESDGAQLAASWRMLLESENYNVRERALARLSATGDRTRLDRMRELIHGETIHERKAAAAAVAALGDRNAIPALEVLLHDSNPHGRIAGATALVALGSTRSLPTLREVVHQESGWAKKTLEEQLAALEAVSTR